MIRVSLLHIAPRLGDVTYNQSLIERGILESAENGANWIITPELATCGYFFSDIVGTAWITLQPDDWLKKLCRLASTKSLNLIINHPERDPKTGHLHNTAFAIDSTGTIVAKHRKIAVHPGPEEGWSMPGRSLRPFVMGGIVVGLLICADIYEGKYAKILKTRGAELIISPVAWGAKYGPGDRWEKRTQETNLPLWVCNRTGKEKHVDWTGGDSIVAKNGIRMLNYSSSNPSILLFDWDIIKMELVSDHFETHLLF